MIEGGLYGHSGGVNASTGLSTSPNSPNNQGGGFWLYVSTNKTTDITNGTFFSDGDDLGMKPGDIVFNVQFTSAGSSAVLVIAPITGVSTAGAVVASGSIISSTYS